MLLFINDFQVFSSQDIVFNWEHMLEFGAFSDAKVALFPLLAAHVYVFVQFICDILWIAGLFTCLAAHIMMVNFVARIGLSYEQNFPATNSLAVAVYLLCEK